MDFHSFTYAAFFLVVWSLNLTLPHRLQNRMLLAASYVFYGWWDYRFLALILLSTGTDFLCGRMIDRLDRREKKARKRWVGLSLAINLGVLAVFKYFDFFTQSAAELLGLFGLQVNPLILHLTLPVGVSFYTFQSISFTIDVYRNQVKPARNFLDYALYVSFFPQLVAGPIERGKNLLPQVVNPRTLTAERLSEGLLLIFWGLFKKIFIADNLARLCDPVFANPGTADGGMTLIALYLFAWQVYCDFSAYTDLARGSAKLLGFEIMDNFRTPYWATNIQDFWNRWHISLSSWIRDYLYYPLALARVNGRHLDVKLVTLFTFLIIGLWHGAGWGYVLWGLYHGLILAGYSLLVPKMRPYRGPKATALRLALKVGSIILTFHVIVLGGIFFRSASLAKAWQMLVNLVGDPWLDRPDLVLFQKMMFYLWPMLVMEFFLYHKKALTRFFDLPRPARYAWYYLCFYLAAMYGSAKAGFIYFQF